MKSYREIFTVGDRLIAEVNFLPENEEEEADLFDGFVTERGPHGEYVLKFSWLLRYPKNPGTLHRSRLSVTAHPNLSPWIVMSETQWFIRLLNTLLEQK